MEKQSRSSDEVTINDGVAIHDGVAINVEGHQQALWRDLLAVDNVSFSVQSGEIFGLLGPERRGQEYADSHADHVSAAHQRHGDRGGARHHRAIPTPCAATSA